MTQTPDRGTLMRWNDDRGFGFIRPQSGGKEIFLHITALSTGSRRPQVGDVIYYTPTADQTGKLRAMNAHIQGATPPPSSKSRRPGQPSLTPSRSPSPTPLIAPSPVRQHTARQAGKQAPTKLEQALGVGFGLISIGVVVSQFDVGRLFAGWSGSSESVLVANPSGTEPHSDCDIKGNISINSGRKLYHLPGMEDYANTNIEAQHGERWFCSEAEAIAAGWQKAPR